MTLWMLGLLGCGWMGPELQLSAVEPREVRPGAGLQVLGDGFDEDAVVTLVSGDKVFPLQGTQVKGRVLIEGQIPEVDAGEWAVVVTQAGETVRGSLRVLASPPDEPCSHGYRANTQLSVPGKFVVVDRFYEDGNREQVRATLGEIERVEYLESVLDDGKTCSAILLRKTDGAALLFEDDDEALLKERAYKLAEYMGKELAEIQ